MEEGGGRMVLVAIIRRRSDRKLRSSPLLLSEHYKKMKVHRFTSNLQGLQKVMVKDFSRNIIP